jgi:hypothetical protein
MWKKANAFFSPGSYFLFPLLLSSRFSQKKEAGEIAGSYYQIFM